MPPFGRTASQSAERTAVSAESSCHSGRRAQDSAKSKSKESNQ